MIRRSKIKRKTAAPPPSSSVKKAVAKPVVIPEFHYIKTCTHNLEIDKDTGKGTAKERGLLCPMCKLIERETASWVQDERDRNERIRMQSFYRRAEMRYCLLREWSKNQLSGYGRILEGHHAEIVLCSGIVEALANSANLEHDLMDLEKNLNKRNRILEVGDYAATYIQCRVRGMCTRLRVRDFMLRRFEYSHETNRRAAYFIDKANGSKWHEPPKIIGQFPPTTPRTIQRRLRYQEGLRVQRLNKFMRIMNANENNVRTLWEILEQNMVYMRQMVLLRDVLHSSMEALALRRRQAGEHPTVKLIPSSSTSENEVSVGKNTRRRRATRNEPPPDMTEQSGFPFWFTVSNPAPSARQIYMSLVLETEPLPSELVISMTDEEKAAAEETKVMATFVNSDKPDEIKEESTKEEEPLTVNRRFQILDQRVWEMMMCFTADEMIQKLAKAEEIGPALSSCAQIAEDTHGIWHANPSDDEDSDNDSQAVVENPPESPKRELIRMQTHATLSPVVKTVAKNEFDGIEEGDVREEGEASIYTFEDSPLKRLHTTNDIEAAQKEADEREAERKLQKTGKRRKKYKDESLYIPIQLQIHPYYSKRSPVGMFRLFFIDGILLAACHASHWTHYSEVWKWRNNVAKCFLEFSQTEKIKSMVQNLIEKANETRDGRGADWGLVKPAFTTDTLSQPKTPSRGSGSCLSVALPDEKKIFGTSPMIGPSPLTSEEYKRVDQKYRFLRKMKVWKDYKRKTLSRFRPSNDDSDEEDYGTSVIANNPAPGVINQIPPAEQLLGTKPYQLSCQSVPQASLLPRTRDVNSKFSGSSAYRTLLRRAMNDIDTDMKDKFSFPDGNSFTQDMESKITPHPNFNLVVLDVHVELPPMDYIPPQKLAEEKKKRHSSKLGSSDRRKSSKSQQETPPEQKPFHFVAEIQQVVGVYPSNGERPPAAIDLGMFAWSNITGMASKSAAIRDSLAKLVFAQSTDENDSGDEKADTVKSKPVTSEDAMTAMILGKNEEEETVHWSAVSHEAGIYKATFPAPMKNEFQLRVLGKAPSRDFVDREVPRKVRAWLGLKY